MPRHLLPSSLLPSTQPTQQLECVPLSCWCWRCMQTFSTPSNLRQHQKQQATCSPSDNVTARQVHDQVTGCLRFRTKEEHLECDCNHKREDYWRFLSRLVSIPLHSFVNLLINTLFTSTQDYEWHCS